MQMLMLILYDIKNSGHLQIMKDKVELFYSSFWINLEEMIY